MTQDECSSSNRSTTSRKGGAAFTITEECERLFCETLWDTFLVEKKAPVGSLVTEASKGSKLYPNRLREWIEVWDYVGDQRFRGFIAGGFEKSLFVFFESTVVGKDLKHGVMALIELGSSEALNCSKLVICLDRSINEHDIGTLTRDLGWVGFELTTLKSWTGQERTSTEWLFLAMES